MRAPICDEAEPPLIEVDGVAHVSACHFAKDLAAKDVQAEEVFAVTGTELEDPAAQTLAGPGTSGGAVHPPPGEDSVDGQAETSVSGPGGTAQVGHLPNPVGDPAAEVTTEPTDPGSTR